MLHRTKRIVKKLSHESEKKIRDIIKAEAGPDVILERRGGAFTFDIDVTTGESGNQHSASNDRWEAQRRTVKAPSNRKNQMEVDAVSSNRFDPLWEDEEDVMQCGVCHPGERFHWP